MRSIWVFLARSRFAAKTTDYERWISLDFLGFSRPNRDFSMGYTDFSAKNFSSCFLCGVGDARSAGVAFGMRTNRTVHGAKLTLISDYLQSNVVARAVSQSSGAHFGCGAADPSEVPGGGATFRSCTLGAPSSMAGSTSFGWITPFDWFSFLLRSSAGAVGSAPGVVSRGAESGGAAGFGAWANAGPATSAAPATNRQGRNPMVRMRLKRVDVRSVPSRRIATLVLKTTPRRHPHPHHSGHRRLNLQNENSRF
jgi:hypothetical protein